jgi:hypothetical protein
MSLGHRMTAASGDRPTSTSGRTWTPQSLPRVQLNLVAPAPRCFSAHKLLPISPVLNQGAAQARRSRTRSACWRAPPGIGRRTGTVSGLDIPAGVRVRYDGAMQSDVWRDIRALRATPTGRAATDPWRTRTFRAALRQAEELATAASVARSATSALPLFYAAEQIGHAICATRRDDIYPTTHGLAFRLDHREKNLLRGQVRPSEGDGTFQAVCDALGSPRLAGPVELGALWAANPDLRSVPIPPSYGSWPRVIVHAAGLPRRTDDGQLVPGVEFIETGGRVPLEVPVAGETVAEVEAGLNLYPTLEAARGMTSDIHGERFGMPDEEVIRGFYGDEPVARALVGRPAPATLSYPAYWKLHDELFSVIEFERAHTGRGAANRMGFALPKVGGGIAPHPLMLWWAFLLGLSSLVRYHPGQWTDALSLDSSKLAVHLEHVLEIASIRVPERLLAALQPEG